MSIGNSLSNEARCNRKTLNEIVMLMGEGCDMGLLNIYGLVLLVEKIREESVFIRG